ncbi:MAG TPA: histidine phosphatase family protein [Myxococcota bacterium]|nr:histidine phosphatase family protein [Myxococcota bacterium]
MSASEVVLIRHAESVWNAEGRWQGQEDPPLSARGLAQADLLAESLRDAGVLRIVTSDLRRARATAETLARALGLEPIADPRLRELDVGRWGGRTREEITRVDAELLARFDGGDLEACAGGAESLARLAQRARAALADWVATSPQPVIAVVTHLGWLRTVWPGADFAHAEWRIARSESLLREDGSA